MFQTPPPDFIKLIKMYFQYFNIRSLTWFVLGPLSDFLCAQDGWERGRWVKSQRGGLLCTVFPFVELLFHPSPHPHPGQILVPDATIFCQTEQPCYCEPAPPLEWSSHLLVAWGSASVPDYPEGFVCRGYFLVFVWLWVWWMISGPNGEPPLFLVSISLLRLIEMEVIVPSSPVLFRLMQPRVKANVSFQRSFMSQNAPNCCVLLKILLWMRPRHR